MKLRNILIPLFFLIALLCGFAFTGSAQVTTSAMNGSVTDETGPLPGATVVVIHTPSGTQYSTSVNENGRFNIANMRVGGPYTVTITFLGYQTQTVEGITLTLGEPFFLEVEMGQETAQLGEVVVTADASKLNIKKTGAATNVNVGEINTLPSISRGITDFTRLTPQANANSFAGRDGRYNNVQIDGANFNYGFGLSDNLLPGGNAQPISLDAIEEMQVNIAPYDVRQSGFTGAGINAVTRSGTNTFEGSAYGFYRNERRFRGAWVNDNRLPEPESPSDASTHIIGFRLGGPIIKDKLFFFVSAETEDNSRPGNLWRPSEDGNLNLDENIARTRRTDLERVYDHLYNVYGYDPGRYEGYGNTFNAQNDKILARIDWNINDKHKLAVRYNQVVATDDANVNGNSGPRPRTANGHNRVSQYAIAFENANYGFENSVRSVTLELNSNFTSRLSNQFLATYTRNQDTRTSPSEIFPFVDIWEDNDIYMSFGYELFTLDNDVVNDNYSIVNNLTYASGKHTITGGASFEVQKFANNYVRLGTSYYRYASVDDFINDAAPLTFGVTYPYPGMDPYARVNYGLAGLYAQDEIAVNDQFELTLGLRAELPIYMNSLTANPALDQLVLLSPSGGETTYSTGEWPTARVMLSPRVGFRYDVLGDRTLMLRGGSGIFAGNIPFVWLTNQPTNAGVLQNTVEPGDYESIQDWIGDIRFNPDPYYWVENGPQDVFIQSPDDGIPGGFALVDDDFRMPQVWRSSVGADYVIPNTNLLVTTDLLYTRDIRSVYQFGANLKPAEHTMNYSGDNRDFWPQGELAYNNQLGGGNGVVLANSDRGYSFSGTIGLSMRARNGFYGSLFYTHTVAKEVTANAGSNAGSAWGGSPNINSPNDLLLYHSNFALPHRLVGSLSYRLGAEGRATTLSLFYSGSSQGRFSYTYGGDLNGNSQNDLLYVPQSASELNFVNITNADGDVLFDVQDQIEAFDNYVNNHKELRDSRGGYAKRNIGVMPWLNNWDVRVLQDISPTIGGRQHTLQLSLDLLNVGNFIRSKWGVMKQLNGAETLLNVEEVTNDGVPTFTMNLVDGELPTTPFSDIVSPATTWSMQLGLRYIF